jgi:hypothetical protein
MLSMKSFIVTNLFLSLATVAVANYGVNMAVGTSVTSFKITIPNYDTSETIKKIVKEESNNKIVKMNTKVNDDNNDYTASIKVIDKVSTKKSSIDKIKFLSITKKIIAHEKVIAPMAVNNKIKNNYKEITKDSLELSYKEIDDQGEYSVKKVNHITWTNYELNLSDYSNIDKNRLAEKNKIKKQRISTLTKFNDETSSNKELPKVTTKEASITNESDELVFFDYDEPQPVGSESHSIVNQKEVKQAVVKKESPKYTGISATVKSVPSITKDSRLDFSNLGKLIKKDRVKTAMSGTQKNNQKALSGLFDKKKSIKKETTDEKIQALFGNDNEYACLNAQDSKIKTKHKSIYNIGLNSIQNNNKDFKKIYNFDIRFQDDVDDIAQDYGEGNIKLEYNLTTQMNMRRGVIFTKSHYPTAIDFVFEPGTMSATIPVLHRDAFDNLTQDYRAIGGHVLVELDDSTEDVELDADTSYEGKLFLNSNLHIVNRNDSDYSYIMFIGVKTGNSIIHFKKSNNQITNKIIHISSNEIYYEPNFYATIKSDTFSLYEENLLSKCKSLLDVDEEKIKPWSFEGKSSKTTLNTHEIGKMLYPLGTRKYYELSHLNENVFIGRWNSEHLIVPSDDYINYVIGHFDMGNSDSQCVVQLNINKKAKGIYYNGLSSEGPMPIQMNILDADGQFYSDFSEKSERVFLLGEQQGIINIKLEYIDGTSQYLQSYCSDSTYLIEQL